jgi:hypothetical protein
MYKANWDDPSRRENGSLRRSDRVMPLIQPNEFGEFLPLDIKQMIYSMQRVLVLTNLKIFDIRLTIQRN